MLQAALYCVSAAIKQLTRVFITFSVLCLGSLFIFGAEKADAAFDRFVARLTMPFRKAQQVVGYLPPEIKAKVDRVAVLEETVGNLKEKLAAAKDEVANLARQLFLAV